MAFKRVFIPFGRQISLQFLLAVKTDDRGVGGYPFVIQVEPGLIQSAPIVHGKDCFGAQNFHEGLNTAGSVLFQAGIQGHKGHIDQASGGINDTLAALCGLVEISGEGFFRSGFLPAPVTVRAFADMLEESLETTVRVMAPEDRIIRRVGLCSGSGGSEWHLALEAGCDAFVSGEIHHHFALAMADAGIAAFECGHFATEEPGLAALAEALQNSLNHVECNVRVFVSAVSAYSFPRHP